MRLRNLPQMKERYMEIVVICDATFISFYGGKENTDKYVRALMVSVRITHENMQLFWDFLSACAHHTTWDRMK